jgi:hypothetical protein
MAKIVISLFCTADGVVEAPDKFMRNWDDAMSEDLQDQLSTWEASLLGRHQYDDWAAYWPNYTGAEDRSFADKINSIPKYVVTSTPLRRRHRPAAGADLRQDHPHRIPPRPLSTVTICRTGSRRFECWWVSVRVSTEPELSGR